MKSIRGDSLIQLIGRLYGAVLIRVVICSLAGLGLCTRDVIFTRKGAETDSGAKFGKETVAGAHWRPKWVPYYHVRASQSYS
jgi:hypothetical protein